MPLDPALGIPTAPDQRTAERLGDLERRLRALENGRPTIQVGAGAPSTSPRDGTPYGDSTNVRLWLRVGGAWHYTTLT